MKKRNWTYLLALGLAAGILITSPIFANPGDPANAFDIKRVPLTFSSKKGADRDRLMHALRPVQSGKEKTNTLDLSFPTTKAGVFCNGHDKNHGQLITRPSLVASLSADQLSATLPPILLQITGQPKCGVDVYYIKYSTLGGHGEKTTATGALQIPTGKGCAKPNPILLYAHGTAITKSYNIANILDKNNEAYDESLLVLAMYAAQGFLVVAPNYAGYDASTLSYHPYVNAIQQSGEMRDILNAGTMALRKIAPIKANIKKLLITGDSEGGFVALATQRAFEKAHLKVTAVAPVSGPLALEAFGDLIFTGDVNIGSVLFAPLVTTSYQEEFGNIYSITSDIYSSQYATGIGTLLPTNLLESELFTKGLLPPSAFFNSTTPTAAEINDEGIPAPLDSELAAIMQVPSNPVFASGFGSPSLIINSYRTNYVYDAVVDPDGALSGDHCANLAKNVPSINKLRAALYKNDLRDSGHWVPKAPLLMIGGVQDPTVFYVNNQIMDQFWACPAHHAKQISIYSVDPYPNTTGDPIQTAFLQAEAALLASGGEIAVLENYHGGLVPPFGLYKARQFFLTVLHQDEKHN